LKEIISFDKKEDIENRIRTVIEKFISEYVYKKPSLSKDVVSCLEKQKLEFNPYPVIHLGSNNLRVLTRQLISYLQRRNVKFLFNTKVENIEYSFSSNQWIIKVVRGGSSQIINSRYLIVSVGKEGNFWFSSLVEKLGGKAEDNSTYMGVRMEISNHTAKNFYRLSFDPKFSLCDRDIKIKTHCFCRHGQVFLLKYFGLPLAGGHTPYIEIDEQYASEKFPNSNFAILYRDKFICTREKALIAMKRVNEITGGTLLLQRLEDFLKNIPTTKQKLDANSIKPSISNVIHGEIPDDLLPEFRKVFISFLERLASCVPGIMNPDNLLYFPAIEWWMRKIEVHENMEVANLPNLYAIGDGSGWTQGIVQSAATGIIAGNDIANKLRSSPYLKSAERFSSCGKERIMNGYNVTETFSYILPLYFSYSDEMRR
jgi:uncharacterized FAD-dependent dehydrogenase